MPFIYVKNCSQSLLKHAKILKLLIFLGTNLNFFANHKFIDVIYFVRFYETFLVMRKLCTVGRHFNFCKLVVLIVVWN